MEGYLGEVEIDKAETEYAKWNRVDWALDWIERYGQIDGEHHKVWVLDQVARILNGTPVLVFKASWEDGTIELRPRLGEPDGWYLAWVKDMKNGGEYAYDEGIAP